LINALLNLADCSLSLSDLLVEHSHHVGTILTQECLNRSELRQDIFLEAVDNSLLASVVCTKSLEGLSSFLPVVLDLTLQGSNLCDTLSQLVEDRIDSIDTTGDLGNLGIESLLVNLTFGDSLNVIDGILKLINSVLKDSGLCVFLFRSRNLHFQLL
jgi:hypothetical protein